MIAPADQTTLAGLNEYTNYSITVFASTSKGGGNQSTPIVVITDEDSELSLVLFIYALSNFDNFFAFNYLFLHSINSFLHCVTEKLHFSQSIGLEKIVHVYIVLGLDRHSTHSFIGGSMSWLWPVAMVTLFLQRKFLLISFARVFKRCVVSERL